MQQKDYEGDAGLILQTLRSFNVKVEGITVSTGPALTLYAVTPSIGTKVSKIRNLKDEIAIALAVPSVRIIAPMPNGTIGIEVPNKQRSIIPAADIFTSPEYANTDMTLPLCIGRQVDGSVFMADLTEMPHLLVAGATGQGKSVGLNVMLLSLLKKKSPDEMKLILIDPKRVELSIYSSITPYLAAPVITEADEAIRKLQAVCELMDERYELLSFAGVRNIKEYNTLAKRAHRPFAPLPYLVVVIDEYGDLIMQAGRDMEQAICRIAQKARAVGIHLIVSTQRPSVAIVTGNIKANFPTRIAFRTTTGTDSRVILDQTGAEKLTGRGDMLFFNGSDIARVQCAYASMDDVTATCQDIIAEYADYVSAPIIKQREGEKPVIHIVKMSAPMHPLTGAAAMYVADLEEVSESFLLGGMNMAFMDARKVFNQLIELGIIESSKYTLYQRYNQGRRRVLMHDKDAIANLIEKYSTKN